MRTRGKGPKQQISCPALSPDGMALAGRHGSGRTAWLDPHVSLRHCVRGSPTHTPDQLTTPQTRRPVGSHAAHAPPPPHSANAQAATISSSMMPCSGMRSISCVSLRCRGQRNSPRSFRMNAPWPVRRQIMHRCSRPQNPWRCLLHPCPANRRVRMQRASVGRMPTAAPRSSVDRGSDVKQSQSTNTPSK